MAITINGVRFSYCSLFQPVKRHENEDPKYSVTILLPKSNTEGKEALDHAIAQAINDGVSKKWNGVKPPYIAIPVHDGDGGRPSDGMPFGEECRGCWVFTASSKQAPFVVDANVQNIINPQEVYSGMYGNVNVTFFPYNSNGKKGVGCGLNGVQKVSDGDPLSGRVTAADAFKPVTQQDTAPGYGGNQVPNGYGTQAPNNGYANNGYGNAPGYGGNQVPNGYGNQAPNNGYANNGYGNAPGYGAAPNGYSNQAPNNGYGNAPGYDTNQNGYGNVSANGYGAYPPANGYGNNGYPMSVDPNTGEVLNYGYNPSGMPVAGI